MVLVIGMLIAGAIFVSILANKTPSAEIPTTLDLATATEEEEDSRIDRFCSFIEREYDGPDAPRQEVLARADVALIFACRQ